MNSLGPLLSGFKIVIQEPVAVYNRFYMFKKHRKKKNRSPRIKVFSHFVDVIEDGQVITNRVNRTMYMNRATSRQLQQAAERNQYESG